MRMVMAFLSLTIIASCADNPSPVKSVLCGMRESACKQRCSPMPAKESFACRQSCEDSGKDKCG